VIAALEGLSPRMQRAIWEGDVEWLDGHAHCICCCGEHTFGSGCPAYLWGGCRGQGSEEQDHRAWQRFYAQARGFSYEQFYGIEERLDPTAEPG
jgi:hypothetical protein